MGHRLVLVVETSIEHRRIKQCVLKTHPDPLPPSHTRRNHGIHEILLGSGRERAGTSGWVGS